MIPLFILLIATNAVALLMAAMIVSSRTVSFKLRISLFIAILGLMLWQNSIFIADQVSVYLVLWNTLAFWWLSVAVAGFYIFTRGLAHPRGRLSQSSKRRWVDVVFAISVAMQIVAVITLSVVDSVQYVQSVGYVIDRGPGYVVYLLGICISTAALIATLLAGLRHPQVLHKTKRALKIIFYTIIIAATYALVTNVVVPLVTDSQRYIYAGLLTVDIFAVGFAYSVVRGRLLDIKTYTIRSSAYILSLATIAFLYAMAVVGISNVVLGEAAMSAEQLLINIVPAFLLVLLFQPLRKFYDRLTSKIFHQDRYDSSEFFRRFNRRLVSTPDLMELLERSSIEIADTMKASQVFFIVYTDDAKLVSSGTKKHGRLPLADVKTLDEYISNSNQASVIVAENLVDDSSRHVRRMLVSHKIAMILPLTREGEILGYLCLGEHCGIGYTRRDRRVLETLSDEMVIAIQSALSVQKIRELNDNLQRRIDEATSELRRSNAQLQRLDEAKDEFVSMASHQLRTPLTSVKGYIDMVIEGDAGEITDQQKHLLREAFTSSERMVHLINDFLNVSRLQTGKFIIDRRPIDPKKLVAEEIDSLKTSAEQRQLKLSYKAQKSIPKLNLDEGKMRQVVMNFVDNALYYSRPKTTIKIDLRIDDDQLVLTVKDTGIGVPKSEQSHLFSKFFRATNARKQRPDGTGVGLFLAKKVVTSHGGKVIFESEEGVGSTFGFNIPISKNLVDRGDKAND